MPNPSVGSFGYSENLRVGTPEPPAAPAVIAYENGMVLPTSQFIITAGDHIDMPVGPFPSEEAAHLAYRRNQPRGGSVYLSAPTIVRLLRPLAVDLGPIDG